MPGRALVATHNLIYFAGSEITALEVASELKSMDWQVDVAAFFSGEPISPIFQQRGGQP